MKKVSLILAALALVLGISQCKKQEEPVASGEKQHIVLNASFGGGNSKIADPGNGELIWSRNDVIKVSNIGGELGELHCTDTVNGIFEGDINETTGNITFTFGSDINYLHQTGELNKAISLTAEAPYDKNGNYDVTMNMMDRAVVKLDLSKILIMVGQEVNFSAQNGLGVTLFIEREDFVSPFYVAIPAPNRIVKVNNIAVDWNLEPNYFYTAAGEGGAPTGQAIVIEPATPAPTIPTGALSRLFTVSAGEDGEDGTDDDVKVWFSQGNLQYVKSSSTWQFAANQYETVEYEWQNIDEDYEYQDIVGLFGWGTSGWDNGNEYFLPYNTHYLGDDDEYLDPESQENPYQQVGLGYGPIKDGHGGFNLTYEFAEADWGVHNAIANGGNEAGIWRTLSENEWYYLFDEYGWHEARRNKYKKNVTVNGVKGFLIAPDDWDLENYPLQSEYNGTSDPLTWEAAEDAGLVFLPAAGHRKGTYVWSVNEDGFYWSSSAYGDHNDSRKAKIFYFQDGGSSGVGDMSGFKGAAVRLVSDRKN